MTGNEELYRQVTDLNWEIARLRIRGETLRNLVFDLIDELEKVGISYHRKMLLSDIKDKLMLYSTTITEEARV